MVAAKRGSWKAPFGEQDNWSAALFPGRCSAPKESCERNHSQVIDPLGSMLSRLAVLAPTASPQPSPNPSAKKKGSRQRKKKGKRISEKLVARIEVSIDADAAPVTEPNLECEPLDRVADAPHTTASAEDDEMPGWLQSASSVLPTAGETTEKPASPAVPWGDVSRLLEQKALLEALLREAKEEQQATASALDATRAKASTEAVRSSAAHAEVECLERRLHRALAQNDTLERENSRLEVENGRLELTVTQQALDHKAAESDWVARAHIGETQAKATIDGLREENASLRLAHADCKQELVKTRMALAGGVLGVPALAISGSEPPLAISESEPPSTPAPMTPVPMTPVLLDTGDQPTQARTNPKATPRSRGLSLRPKNGAAAHSTAPVAPVLKTTAWSKARSGSLLASRLAQLEAAISDKENALRRWCPDGGDLLIARALISD